MRLAMQQMPVLERVSQPQPSASPALTNSLAEPQAIAASPSQTVHRQPAALCFPPVRYSGVPWLLVLAPYQCGSLRSFLREVLVKAFAYPVVKSSGQGKWWSIVPVNPSAESMNDHSCTSQSRTAGFCRPPLPIPLLRKLWKAV